MWKPQRQIRESCPVCRVPVYAGPITDYDPSVIDIGESMPCPRCGTELVYEVDREWDDGCRICGRSEAVAGCQEAEWREDEQRYRWWCEACTDAFFAMVVSRVSSPRLARAFWYPLAWTSDLLYFSCNIPFWWRLRKLRANWRPKVDEAAAIEIARRECERRGWEWRSRVKTWAAPPDIWIIRTGIGLSGGGDAMFTIDAHTGKVRRAIYAGQPSLSSPDNGAS